MSESTTATRSDQQQAYQGAQYGWRQFLAKLDQVLSRPDAEEKQA
jgi:hypothetical protein